MQKQNSIISGTGRAFIWYEKRCFYLMLSSVQFSYLHIIMKNRSHQFAIGLNYTLH